MLVIPCLSTGYSERERVSILFSTLTWAQDKNVIVLGLSLPSLGFLVKSTLYWPGRPKGSAPVQALRDVVFIEQSMATTSCGKKANSLTIGLIN